MTPTKPFRRVIIATPALDGRVDAIYAYALAQTTWAGAHAGVQFLPLLVTREALIQRARNDLARMALSSDASDVIWIDSDIGWKPEWVMRLLTHQADVVGGTYRRKTDAGEAYVCKAKPSDLVPDARGLMTVEGLGAGFLRTSRRALQAVWDAAPEYRNDGIVGRMMFPVSIVDGELQSEDIAFCAALRKAGYPVHLDPTITCDHVGAKTYSGNFDAWAKMLPAPEQALA